MVNRYRILFNLTESSIQMNSQPQQPQPQSYSMVLLKGLEGNQTQAEQAEQAGSAEVQSSNVDAFLDACFLEFNETKSLSKESRQKLDGESKMHLSKLHDLVHEIQKQKDELKKLEEIKIYYIKKYAIRNLLSEITKLLEDGKKFSADSWRALYDCLISDDPELFTIDVSCPEYIRCLYICELIADSDASDQEDKDHAYLELAMHEVRMKKFETANEIASKIIDEYLQGCYQSRLCSFKKKFHLH